LSTNTFNKPSFTHVFHLLIDNIQSNQKKNIIELLLSCCDIITPKFVILSSLEYLKTTKLKIVRILITFNEFIIRCIEEFGSNIIPFKEVIE
jgi:hypothetical protein